jgi:protein TonB
MVRPVYNPSPEYPEQALQQGQEGLVKIRVTVAADGTVRSARLHASSSHTTLDTAALQVVRQWRFMVTAKKGVKETVDVIVPIRFRIESP